MATTYNNPKSTHDHTNKDTNSQSIIKLNIDKNALCNNLQLPIDGLSDDAKKILESVTETYQCSRDIVLSAMYAAVGAAVGKRIRIYDGKYYNYPCLWIAVVAPSGSNKSTPVRQILRPLIDRDSANYKLYKDEMKAYRKAQDDSVEKPIFKQLLISDSTPEARNKALSISTNGILLYRDEIKGFLDDIGRYTRSGEVSQLLSVYDNDNIIVNRKSDDTLLIEQPFMSILGTIQPDVLADAFGRDLLMNNGFVQRWMFVYPDDVPPSMYSESCMPKPIISMWNDYINRLLDFDFASNRLGTLYIANEAKQLYADYYNKLQLKKYGACGFMDSTLSKLQIMVERWAGITHLLGNEPDMSRILPEGMEYSVRCMDYFERCAEKVHMKLTEGKRQPEVKAMGNEEMTARLFFANNPPSIQAFADGVGVSRQFVSKCLKKYEWLRGCGCGDIQVAYNVVDTEKSSATTPNMVSE